MDRVAEGTVLAGKYTLLSKLGQGGMGSVWRAEHVQLRSPVAIKLIEQSIASNPEALARFMREAQSAAALRSPHVVQILDYGADQGVPYIAMELLEGESLASRIVRTRGIPPAETARLMTEVARAISKAHEAGIVHRDLKPDNIFIVRNDEEEVAKVLDFGIAKSQNTFGVTTGSATRTGAVLGTPYYMSPEQAEGNRQVDHRTDIWALGVIAFECLLGRRPFDSDALGSLLLAICTRPIPVPSSLGRVPPGFDAWFLRACARELGERFQSARELAAELRRVCGEAARDPRESGGHTAGVPHTTQAVTGPSPHAAPTANTYSTSVSPEKSHGSLVAILLGGAFLTVVVAGATGLVLKKRASDAEAEASAHQAPVEPPAETKATAAPATAPPVVSVAPAATAAPEPLPSASSRATPPTPSVAALGPRRPTPKASATTAKTSETPATPPPPPKPTTTTTSTAKPKGVNLGI